MRMEAAKGSKHQAFSIEVIDCAASAEGEDVLLRLDTRSVASQ
jgi:hypothetical protein